MVLHKYFFFFFAYAKVYTLYKTYSFAYTKYIVLRMYMVLHAAWSALKPEAEMVSEASRGRYDFDKPVNITDLYQQSNRTN